jgi:hypothetical protein
VHARAAAGDTGEGGIQPDCTVSYISSFGKANAAATPLSQCDGSNEPRWEIRTDAAACPCNTMLDPTCNPANERDNLVLDIDDPVAQPDGTQVVANCVTEAWARSSPTKRAQSAEAHGRLRLPGAHVRAHASRNIPILHYRPGGTRTARRVERARDQRDFRRCRPAGACSLGPVLVFEHDACAPVHHDLAKGCA